MWRYRLSIWMDRHLDPDWRFVQRLWSARLAFLAAALEGAFAATGAFQNYVSAGQFLVICMGLSLAVLVARLVKQPDVPCQ